MTRTARPAGRTALLVAALAVVASGCSLGLVESVQPPPAAGQVGGSVVVAVPQPGSIDPGNAFEPVGTMISGLVCDTLLGVDAETGELVGALAESWQVTGDGEAVIVRLRDGARFHDGTEVTASDVVFSLSRAASAEFAGDAAELLSPIVGFEAIRGQVADAPQRLRERLAGVQALTNRTVQITFREHRAGTVALLAHPVTAPVSEQATEADPEGARSQPVCAGPYRVAEPWERGDPVVHLERFEDYHGQHVAHTGGGAGYLEEIRFRIVPDLATPEPAPTPSPGSKDDVPPPVVAPPAPPPLDAFDAAVVTADRGPAISDDPGLTLVQVPGPGVEYVGLPFSEPQREDVADGAEEEATAGEATPGEATPGAVLREALSRALDREALATDVLGGARLPATGFLPPTLGTLWSRTSPCGDAVPAQADVAGARRVLAQAGLSLGGTQLEFTFNDDLRNRTLVEALAEQWEDALGVDVVLTPLTWEEYVTRAGDTTPFPGPFRFSWSVPYPDADQYVAPLFLTGGIGTTNFSGYSSATLDDFIHDDARRAALVEDRALLYQQTEDRLCEDLPLIPLLQEQHSYAVRTERLASATDVFAGGPRGELLLRELYLTDG